MKSWRRCITIIPVLAGLASAVLLSCGGSGGNSGNITMIRPTTLFAVLVCTGAPPTPIQTPTPPPSPTKTPKPTPTPTPTPTPQCSPVTSAAICIPNNTAPFCNTAPTPPTTLQFNAQGAFTTRNPKARYAYRDVTNNASTVWNPFGSNPPNFTGQLVYVGNGMFAALQPTNSAGCACFNVTDAGIASQSVLVGVNQDASNCTTPCLQVPTNTPTPPSRVSPADGQANDHAGQAP